MDKGLQKSGVETKFVHVGMENSSVSKSTPKAILILIPYK